MSRDFTFKIFRQLLVALNEQQYTFQTFAQFLKDPAPKVIVLRHDVDALKANSLTTAKLEQEMGIVGTYFFRMVPQSFDEDVVQEIASYGHEIGYHYEDLAMAKGNLEKAMNLFKQNLERLRQVVQIETICMHGSPLSRFDNRKLWNNYNYRDFGLIGEPYFDVDFSKVLYLTDTGRMWDGEKVSVRDKVNTTGGDGKDTYKMHSTFDIISASNAGLLPGQVLINVHPQRWDDRKLLWAKEFVFQSTKNIFKRLISS